MCLPGTWSITRITPTKQMCCLDYKSGEVMADGKCPWGAKEGEGCSICGSDAAPLYWCESCGEYVEEKRCPLCGLKAKRVREDRNKP